MRIVRLSDERLKDIETMLEYLLRSEQTSYEEYCCGLLKTHHENYNFLFDKAFYSRQDVNHIYACARRVQDDISQTL